MQVDSLKRIKVRIDEGARQGATLLQKSPKSFKELESILTNFLIEHHYDHTLYSLYYNDGEDSIHLQN